MIRFACPACRSVLECPDYKAGKKIACLKCGQRLQIPSVAVPRARDRTVLGSLVAFFMPRRRESSRQGAQRGIMISFDCPQCGKSFQVKEEFAGRKTKCRQCG